MSTSKEVKNCTWQLSELRSGAADQSGAVSSQAGSLLFILDKNVKTATQSVLEALGKSVTAIQETIEKGVHPDKSHKRKFKAQEAEDKERMARQKLDQEGPKESFFHPFSGQVSTSLGTLIFLATCSNHQSNAFPRVSAFLVPETST